MTNGEKFMEVFGFGADGSRVIAVNATWWDCEYQSRKRINADRIRSLSDIQLALFLYWQVEGSGKTLQQWQDWLRKEAEDDNTKS